MEFTVSQIRGGLLGPERWILRGQVIGEIPPSFRAQPARFNFRDVEDFNGEFQAYVAGGTVTISYIKSPGTTIVGPAPPGSFAFRGVTRVVHFD